MNISDPIADMLTRVRNASRARHTEVIVPASRTKREIARILKAEGFIADVAEERPLPEADAAEREPSHVGPRPAADEAAVVAADFELRLARRLCDQ